MEFIRSLIDGVEELTGIKLTEDDLADVRQELITVLMVAAYHKNKEISDKQVASVFSLFEGVRKLQMRAAKGDESAQLLIMGVEKLVNPPKMIRSDKSKKKPFLPIVKDLVEGYWTSPHLIQAWEVRNIMSSLSFIVEPVCSCPKSKLNDFPPSCRCLKLQPKSKVKLRLRPILKNTKLIKEANLLNVKTGVNKRSFQTWQGLAVRIYLNRLLKKTPDSKLTESEIKRSLRKLSEFEKVHPEEVERSYKLPVYHGDPLTYQFSRHKK